MKIFNAEFAEGAESYGGGDVFLREYWRLKRSEPRDISLRTQRSLR